MQEAAKQILDTVINEMHAVVLCVLWTMSVHNQKFASYKYFTCQKSGSLGTNKVLFTYLFIYFVVMKNKTLKWEQNGTLTFNALYFGVKEI